MEYNTNTWSALRAAKKTTKISGKVFEQFCNSSSMHGVKYIVDKESNWWERIGWLIVFLLGCAFSTYFCLAMWNKWVESPTIMSLETTRYPLSNLPFPAVSICSVNKISNRRLKDALASTKRDDSDQLLFHNVPYERIQETLRYMTKLDRALGDGQDERLNTLNKYYEDKGISSKHLYRLMKDTSVGFPNCKDVVLDCTWQGMTSTKQNQSCYDLFAFMPTDDGFCCVFNGGNYTDEALGISVVSSREQLFVSGNGYRQGLSVVLNSDVDDYAVTNGKYDGFKVLVHATQKFADVADRGFFVGPGHEVSVGVKGTSSDTSNDIDTKLTDSQRKKICRSEKDSTVTQFWKYSQSGCIIECATKLIKNQFDCRPFFLRSQLNESTPLCDMTKYSKVAEKYENIRTDPEGQDPPCDCPPPCSDEWFSPEISYAPFPGHGFGFSRTYKRVADRLGLDRDGFDVHGPIGINFKENLTMLHVYYKDRTGIRYKTDIRYGVEDFLTAMGGLLGLGLGISFISILELFYFIFLRCFCHYRYDDSKDEIFDDSFATLNV